MEWYPSDKQELENQLKKFLSQKLEIEKPSKINGIIVPHAGYLFSGKIAGKAFKLLKNYLKKQDIKKIILLSPSHYSSLQGAATAQEELKTPLGKLKTFNLDFYETDLSREHAINNQIPFLQKMNIKEILPLMIGNTTNSEAKEIAQNISKSNSFFIISTDLSHFLHYDEAVIKDKETIKIIENLDFDSFNKIDACGFYPLLIMFHLCKILQTKPHLIEYKNSGDIIGEKSQVVGYASFYF